MLFVEIIIDPIALLAVAINCYASSAKLFNQLLTSHIYTLAHPRHNDGDSATVRLARSITAFGSTAE